LLSLLSVVCLAVLCACSFPTRRSSDLVVVYDEVDADTLLFVVDGADGVVAVDRAGFTEVQAAVVLDDGEHVLPVVGGEPQFDVVGEVVAAQPFEVGAFEVDTDHAWGDVFDLGNFVDTPLDLTSIRMI